MRIVGIEGGGTKTRALIQRDGPESTPFFCEWNLSLKVKEGDFATAAAKLAECLAEEGRVDSLGMGLSGMSRADDQEALKRALRSHAIFEHTNMHIEGDGTLTLKAAIPDGE